MTRWLIWSLFAVIWTVLLLLPGKEFTRVGVDQWPTSLHMTVKKGSHLAAYATFTFLSGLLPVRARYRWILLFVMMAHSAITETIQQHIGRNGCLEDVNLNFVGILVGLGVGWKWWTDPK